VTSVRQLVSAGEQVKDCD